MIGLAAGITIAAMVGPLGPGADAGPEMRISRPEGAQSVPVVVTHVGSAARFDRSRLIEVPDSAVAGGGGVTIVGAGSEPIGHPATEMLGDLQTGLYTEQLFRAFGYDRDHFGYSIIDYPRSHGGGGFGGGQQDAPAIDPRILGLLRDLAPIEAKYPVAIPGR